MIDLRVTLTMENRAFYFNTRRLIYMIFIDPKLNYKKGGLYVINIDHDGYNNRPDNLKLENVPSPGTVYFLSFKQPIG